MGNGYQLDDQHVNIGKQHFINSIEESGTFGIENSACTNIAQQRRTLAVI